MYANLVQVCTAINREFLFPGAKKKKKKERASGIQCLFCYPVLPMATQSSAIPHMYLQFFHALSFVATVHGL